MAEHPSVRSRADNILFVRFNGRAVPGGNGSVAPRTCRSCAHWYGDAEGEGCCLADCGIRPTPPQGRCAEWRHPPILTVV